MVGYKINTNISVAFLYTDEKWAEKEIMVTTPFIIAMNDIKYLGVPLTKQMKDPYVRNFKTLKKEIKEGLSSCKISHDHGSVGLT